MDGQSRTCIEWMCNDEYEPGSFDLNDIMSPPDHESIFHSMMNATPLGGEEWQGAGLATTPGGSTSRTLASLPSDPALITPTSLVSLVQQMELTPGSKAGAEAGSEAGGSAVDPAAVRSLTQAVSEALGGGGTEEEHGLSRVASDTGLNELAMIQRYAQRGRRPSISCPNSPPRTRRSDNSPSLPRRGSNSPPVPRRGSISPRDVPRRAANSFFTPSLFHPERSADICREWHQQHPDQLDAAAGAGAAAAAATPSRVLLATAGGMTGPPLPAAAERKKSRTKPRPSRLRELNFLAPSSM